MFTLWHALFPLTLMFRAVRTEAPPPSTVQGKCIYTFFKGENQAIQLPLLCTKPSKDKHKFLLSKVGSPGADLVALRA